MDHRHKCKTIKCIKDNIEENLDDLGYGYLFTHNSRVTNHERATNKLAIIVLILLAIVKIKTLPNHYL